MMLTVTETLRHGPGEGSKVALAPLITDLPIVLATLYLLRQLATFDAVLGGIGLVGGLYLLHLGHETFVSRVPADAMIQIPASLRRGAVVNALSPHPYLFWATVGGPIVLQAAQHSLLAAVLFIGCFYVCLIGAKLSIALMVGRWRDLLISGPYRAVMRTLGVVLMGFGIVLILEGLRLAGLLAI